MASFVALCPLVLLGLVTLLPTILAQASLQEWDGQAATCTQPFIRKEWRKLSESQRIEYTDAVQCLWKKEAIGRQWFPTLRTRHDDFVANHVNSTRGMLSGTGGVHNTGDFLPWHRYMLHAYEGALRSECNYTGTQPYWDWTLDTPTSNPPGSFLKSPIFDPITGFGGNGVKDPIPAATAAPAFPFFFGNVAPAGCVKDGPFKDYVLTVGPGDLIEGDPRCLTRDFNGAMGEQGASPAGIEKLLGAKDYGSFTGAMDFNNHAGIVPGPHTVGHFGVGGEMGNPFTSLNDPLFYLHHSQLDHLWSIWQERGAASKPTIGANQTEPGTLNPRIYEIAGPTTLFGHVQTTLDTMIWMGYTAPALPIRAVMDTLNRDGKGVLCYRYE